MEVAAAEVTSTPDAPGDLLERRGQAGQVEGPGTAITANELPAVPAHGTLILVLLTQKETTASGGGVGPASPEPQGHPGSLARCWPTPAPWAAQDPFGL